jgi:hypothetical protein
MPKVATNAALVSLKTERSEAPRGIGTHGIGAETVSQNSFSFSTRFIGSLPAMIAALMAPIEMPATQSGSKSK